MLCVLLIGVDPWYLAWMSEALSEEQSKPLHLIT